MERWVLHTGLVFKLACLLTLLMRAGAGILCQEPFRPCRVTRNTSWCDSTAMCVEPPLVIMSYASRGSLPVRSMPEELHGVGYVDDPRAFLLSKSNILDFSEAKPPVQGHL